MSNIRYTRKKKNKHLIKLISGIVLGFIIIIILVFGDMGLVKYFKLKKQSEILRSDINNMINESKQLSDQIDKLENDLNYIERIAREELRMAKKGEKIFRVIKNKSAEDFHQ